MIKYHKGNLLDAPQSVIAHGCNAQGVMGSGVALAIREKWPQVFEKYKLVCDQDTQKRYLVGCVVPVIVETDKMILNLITQEEYGKAKDHRYVSYDGLDRSFQTVAGLFNNSSDISSKELAMPKIGAGLGNGHWPIIEEIIKYRLSNIVVHIYEL